MSQNKYVGVEYRYTVMCWVLHDHAARMMTRNRDKAEEHARLARKYRKRIDVLELANSWFARHIHDVAADVARKRPEYKDPAKLSLIYVPFNSDIAKFCKCCGELHDKINMAKTCQHIGDSKSTNHAYYNCSCGSTLVVPKSKSEIKSESESESKAA